MSAYGDVFLNVLCDNYSHTTLKIHSGYNTVHMAMGYHYIQQN